MNFSWGKAIITFIIGITLSFIVGGIYNDSGYMVAVAVCYVGAIIIGILGNNN